MGGSVRQTPDVVSMHLLVLSAFRRKALAVIPKDMIGLNAPFGAQCFPTVWRGFWWEALNCLNAPFGAQCFPTLAAFYDDAHYLPSQCTFWCSVLSDRSEHRAPGARLRSQCTFWCSVLSDAQHRRYTCSNVRVSMHLLVLSAFRRDVAQRAYALEQKVSMHLLVLSAFRPVRAAHSPHNEQVSMHLLVLSAFRPGLRTSCGRHTIRLNAPFGAQCFPTYSTEQVGESYTCLNAPFGAQCFPTGSLARADFSRSVSMHLLVLSAFRPITVRNGSKKVVDTGLNAPFGAQCFPTLGA